MPAEKHPTPESAPTLRRSGVAVRVLVVESSATMRKAMSELIASDPGLVIVGTARDGADAVEKISRLRPDVVTLDLELPVPDGREALVRIRREFQSASGGPPAVIACSGASSAGSHEGLEALRDGGADVFVRDAARLAGDTRLMREELARKIRVAASSRRSLLRSSAFAPGAAVATPGALKPARLPAAHARAIAEIPESQMLRLPGRGITLIVIGSSTGGPPVLEQVLAAIPASLPVPIVIAQHMPISFTSALSQRLDSISPLSVIHGEHGMPLHPGSVYVVPGAHHGRVWSVGSGPMRLEVSTEPRTLPFKPSADELFASAAKLAGPGVLGVVLTGMGEDGKLGSQEIKRARGLILAQDPVSSVVYGMPRGAFTAGGLSMSPDNIARTIASLAPAQSTAA